MLSRSKSVIAFVVQSVAKVAIVQVELPVPGLQAPLRGADLLGGISRLGSPLVDQKILRTR